MKTPPAIRLLDFLAGALTQGLLLLWTAPLLGWLAWFGLTLAAGAVCAAHDRLAALLGRRWRRALLAAYALPVAAHVALSWALTAFHSPVLWALIGLAALWGAALLRWRLDPLFGPVAAATLATAAFLAGDARFAPPAAPTLLCVPGLTVLLLAVFADRLGAVGRPFAVLFLWLGLTMGANDAFYHGADFGVAARAPKSGVAPILTWENRPQSLKDLYGLDLRFVQVEAFGRVTLGTDRGLFVIDERGLIQPPVGPAADNLTANWRTRRNYVAARDGVLSLVEGADARVSQRQPLPHGGLVTRWAPEGVYATDEWRWIGLYDPETLALRRSWDRGPVSDLLPDGEGGFYLTTLSGRLEHHLADGAMQTATLRRRGLFHLLALDRNGQRLFVTNMATTTVQVFDPRTLAPTQELAVDRGARNVLWYEPGKTLLVGLYFRGELVAYDASLKEIGRAYVGRRLRSIQPYGRDGVLIASAGGALSASLPALFPTMTVSGPDPATEDSAPPPPPSPASCAATQ